MHIWFYFSSIKSVIACQNWAWHCWQSSWFIESQISTFPEAWSPAKLQNREHTADFTGQLALQGNKHCTVMLFSFCNKLGYIMLMTLLTKGSWVMLVCVSTHTNISSLLLSPGLLWLISHHNFKTQIMRLCKQMHLTRIWPTQNNIHVKVIASH